MLRFDHPELDRSRTIILATDNQLAGDSDRHPRGGDVVRDRAGGARVRHRARRRLGGGSELDDLRTPDCSAPAASCSASTTPAAGQNIVDEVLDDQATTLEGVPELVVIDHPGWPFRIGVLALWGVVFLAWRSKL